MNITEVQNIYLYNQFVELYKPSYLSIAVHEQMCKCVQIAEKYSNTQNALLLEEIKELKECLKELVRTIESDSELKYAPNSQYGEIITKAKELIK